jgi:hypothetical protein
VPHVWIVDSDLAAQIFLTAFAHEETSDEATNLGGYVLRLTSTRRQDYQLALYVLARHFPQFLESHPLPALRAVIGVLNEHATSHHILPNLREGVSVASRVQEFSFRGASARYLGDLSYIWDATEYPDRPTEMATAALAFVTRLAAEDRWALLDQALVLVAATPADGERTPSQLRRPALRTRPGHSSPHGQRGNQRTGQLHRFLHPTLDARAASLRRVGDSRAWSAAPSRGPKETPCFPRPIARSDTLCPPTNDRGSSPSPPTGE